MAHKSAIQRGSVYAYRGMLRVKIRAPNSVGSNGKPKYMVRSTGLVDTGIDRNARQGDVRSDACRSLSWKRRWVASASQNIKMLFEEYIESNRRMKSTERGYRLAFKTIVRSDYPPETTRIEVDIRQFVTKATVSKTSINTYLRCFKAFLTWLRLAHDW